MATGVLDLGCHCYKNKYANCTKTNVPTFTAMVTIITVMAWLGLGKEGDFG